MEISRRHGLEELYSGTTLQASLTTEDMLQMLKESHLVIYRYNSIKELNMCNNFKGMCGDDATISCQVLHEFCELIFVDEMHTTKSTKSYTLQKFLHARH